MPHFLNYLPGSKRYGKGKTWMVRLRHTTEHRSLSAAVSRGQRTVANEVAAERVVGGG